MNALTKWNDFKGAALQLDNYDLPRIGHIIGVGEDPIHAIFDVESRGEGFRSDGRPVMLREEHHFWRLLGPGKKRDRAVAEGLAYPSWRRNYPKDSYPWLRKAIVLDERAALMSCSWGLAQIMGFNFSMCGYPNVQAFVRAMLEDEALHLEAMVRFIIAAGLDDEMRALEKATTRAQRIAIARVIAAKYNGPSYERNRYHIRIVDRLEWWQRKPDTPWSPQMAAMEEAVAEIDNAVADAVAEDTPPEPDPVDEPAPAPAPEPVKTVTKRDIGMSGAGVVVGGTLISLVVALADTINCAAIKVIDRISAAFDWIGGFIS